MVSFFIFSRFYAIRYPLEARSIHTIKRATILITVFWLVSFLLLLPQLFIQRTEPLLDFSPNGTLRGVVEICAEYFLQPWMRIAYTLFFYLLLYLMPVMVMFVTYGRIASTLWWRQPIGETSASSRDHERRIKEKKRIVCMLIVIVVLFSISWFPFFTTQVYVLFRDHSHHDNTFRMVMAVFQLFGYSSCCINPIVYWFLNENFQQHFMRTICFCKCERPYGKRKPSATSLEMERLQPGLTNHSTHNTTLSTCGSPITAKV